MNILGLGQDTLIVEISNSELEKLLGSYYSNTIPGTNKKVSQLKSGDRVNIQCIEDMTSKVYNAMSDMLKTMKTFKESQNAIMAFAEGFTKIVKELGDKEDDNG